MSRDELDERARSARLERALERFVDATLLHNDLDEARLAFADAQAFGLAEAGREAELWAALELHAAASMPDDLDVDPVDEAQRGRRRLSKRAPS